MSQVFPEIGGKETCACFDTANPIYCIIFAARKQLNHNNYQ